MYLKKYAKQHQHPPPLPYLILLILHTQHHRKNIIYS